MRKLNYSEVITLANMIAQLPQTDDGNAPHIAELLGVYKVEFVRDYDDDNAGFTVFETVEDEKRDRWEEFWVLDLLHKSGDYGGAIKHAINVELNSTPTRLRCPMLSALHGYRPSSRCGIFSQSNTFIKHIAPNNPHQQVDSSELTYTVVDFIFSILIAPNKPQPQVDSSFCHYLIQNSSYIKQLSSGYYYVQYTYYPPGNKDTKEYITLMQGSSEQDVEDKFFEKYPQLKAFGSSGYLIDTIDPMPLRETWKLNITL